MRAAGDEIWARCCEVCGFVGICFEIEDLDGCVGVFANAGTDSFEVIEADGLRPATAGVFPIHDRARSERAATGECRGEIDAVMIWSVELGGGGDGGEEVPDSAGCGGGCAARSGRRADEEWDADAAFVDFALQATTTLGGGEEGGVGATVEGGAVVTGEDDEGVVEEVALAELGDDGSEVTIHACDHGGVCGARVLGFEVSLFAVIGRIVELVGVFGDVGFGGLERGVGNSGGEKEEEGPFA